MKHLDITKALNNLCPDADWTLSGDDYADIDWRSFGTPPSVAEIEEEIAKIPAKEAAIKAKQDADRAAILDRLGISELELRSILNK